MWERVSSSEKIISSSEKGPSLLGARRRTGVLEKFRISSAISSGERTKSARPVLMTLRGMPSNLALSGAWAITRPPCSFTALTPLVPSVPVPERTATMECSRRASAREAKKMSMGWFSVPGA